MTIFTVAGGCFWCLDAVFRQIKGIDTVVSGYTGGMTEQPSYDEVCGGQTGHAEAVQITFDEAVLPADLLLDMFFTMHNPTTRNRQGNDVGMQYRSALFFITDEQKTLFEDAVAQNQLLWDDPIVTEVVALSTFYPAEDYHQDYFTKNPSNGYCNVVINPKLSKIRSKFAQYWKER